MRKPFIAGNWKMFKTAKTAEEFAEEFKKIYTPSDVRVAIAAPFTQLWALKKAFEGTGIGLAAEHALGRRRRVHRRDQRSHA